MRVVFLFLFSCAFACTDFVLQAQDGTFVGGRSLEFATELQSVLRIFPKKQRVISKSPDRKKGLEWITKYGYVGATALGMNFAFDGMNEVGLSFGYLWLPAITEYPTVAPEDRSKALDFTDFGSWVLGNFSSVAEVKEALKEVKIWGHPVPPLGIAPVHAAIHDAKGNHLVVEFVGGKMQVYDNPISVLTNAPAFDWQLTNLQNYAHLDATNVDQITIRGVLVQSPGQGSGFMGIPGDWTPPSRFVKIATYLRFANGVASGADAVNFAEHLLNTVDIPQGEIREKGQDIGDYTQWIVIKDLTKKVFYFRSYKDLCLKMIDLNKLDFGKGSSKTLPLNVSSGYVDMTASLKN
jgi:choloylglycine hydrolase